MRSLYSFFLVCFASILSSLAQQTYSVSGKVEITDGSPLPFANVLLLQQTDSTLVHGGLSREDGSYILKSIPEGNYFIMCSLMGYQPSYSKNFQVTKDEEIKALIMKEEELSEVLVKGTKPLYQQKIDRMVINVENSIVSAGGSALEILERSPGVLVSRQSNSISIVGKEGVVVMINGKNTYVPVSSIIQMLDGMSADNIVSIELITTPPANFDAEGNAGFINIVLKERTDMGFNGSYSLSAGYSNDFITSNNVNFNYRKNKINIFGNYSFSQDGTNQIIALYREYSENGNFITSDTYSDRDAEQRNHNVRAGADYEISNKTITGVLVTAYDNRWTMEAINENFYTENGIPTSYVELVNDEINHWRHFGANYNIKHSFTEERSISLDIDYLYYKDNNPNDYDNTYYDGERNFEGDSLSRSDKVTPIETWVGKLDYSTPVNKKFKLQAGGKTTISNFSNDVSVENLRDNIWVVDPTLTNKSDLEESILAGYLSLEYSFDEKTTAKAGLRYEYTDSQLDTETQGSVVDRQYGEFFPSFYLNRKINDSLNMNISYSRRITRPTFNDLAPFVILFDPNTFISGNASLQPAISSSYKYDITYRSAVLSLQYTHEDASIANFQERLDEETGRLIFEAQNLDYTKTFGVSLGFPLKLYHWWKMQNNFNYVSQQIRGYYYDETIKLTLGNFSANSTQSFKISESISAEISSYYTSKSFFGTAVFDDFYLLNFGLEKTFGEDAGTLRFSVNDILNSFEFRGGTNLPEQNLKTRNLFDFRERTFTLTYTNNFGNQRLKSQRERETGAEEERKRVEQVNK